MIFSSAFILAFCGFVAVVECLDGPCPNISYTPMPVGIPFAGEWTLVYRNLFLEPDKPTKCFKVSILNSGPGTYMSFNHGTYVSGGQFNFSAELKEVAGQNYNFDIELEGQLFLIYNIELSSNYIIGVHDSYDASNNNCTFFLSYATRNGAIISEEKFKKFKLVALAKGVPQVIVDEMFRVSDDIC